MKGIAVGGRLIGERNPTFIIAEAGSNHDGKLEQAHRLIDVAAEAKADAVKFQLFQAEYLYPSNVGMVDTPAGKIDFFEFLQRASLPETWLSELADHARERGLVFLATAFHETAVDALERANVAAHKIASPELTHLPLIRHAAQTGKPVILSTGMARLSDIEDALDAVYSAHNSSVILLHCVSAYPLLLNECNLSVLTTFKTAFQVPVGFSDHTMDPTLAPSAAVALGGCVIEKHFTLDCQLPGPDHPFALEPHQLSEMVSAIRATEKLDSSSRQAMLERPDILPLLGSPIKHPTPSEKELADCDRRTVMVIRDIQLGEFITTEKVRILRAERNLKPGILPKFWDIVLGARAARSIPAGRGLLWDDVMVRD